MSARGDRTLCSSGKRRWTNQADVEKWLSAYRRTKHPKAPRMRAYPCPECAGIHVSHWQTWSPKKRRRGRAS